MKRFPEYKGSDVEWIGELPKHWTISRLKYVSNIPVAYGLNIEADRYTTEGVRFIRITDIDENGGLRQKGVYLAEHSVPHEQMLNRYDLLFSRSGATVGKSYLHLNEGKYTSAGYLVRFNFGDYCTSKFIYYTTLSHIYKDWLGQQVIISTIQNVNGEKYSNFQLPLPSPQEQTKIAAFLDRKTAQIDELIRVKERKIALLQEQRTALINQAVTKGLDLNAKMKPSGVEWIGEIPKDWEIIKVKYLTHQIIDGTHYTPDYQDSGIPFLRVTDLHTQSIDLTRVKYITPELHQELTLRCKPEKGNLLLSKNGTIGITRVIDWEFEFSIFVSICLIKFRTEIYSPHFFSYLFQSQVIDQQLTESSKTSTVTNLHLDKIRELFVVKPPPSRQTQIVNFLDRKTSQIDELVSEEQRSIELLKEYRQSLISDAVTGKIDVRSEV